MKMKYILLDLSVIAAILVAAMKLWLLPGVRTRLAPACPSDLPDSEGTDNDKHTSLHQTANHSSGGRRPQRHSAFRVGETVEVYDPGIHPSLAFFAEILGIGRRDDGSYRCAVRAGPNSDEILDDVDSSMISTHDPYDINTPVMCDYGDSVTNYEDAKLSPCIVLARCSLADSDHDAYFVTRVNDDEILRLPLSRVRRVVHPSHYPEDKFRLPEGSSGGHPRGVVEIYTHRDAIAFPGIIMGPEREGKHLVQQTFTGHIAGMPKEMIRAYVPYTEGAEAYCNVGGYFEKMHVLACRIGAHFIDPRSGVVHYDVTYIDLDGTLVRRNLSSLKIHSLCGERCDETR